MDVRFRHRVTFALLVGVAPSLGIGGTAFAKGPSSALRAVRAAVAATERQGSCSLTVKGGTSTIGGTTVTMTGGGVIDFASARALLGLSTSNGSSTTNEVVVTSGQKLYLSVVVDGANIVQLVSHKAWVGETLADNASTSTSGTNVLFQFRELNQPGVTVTALGAGSVDGMSAEGYRVTVPVSAILATAATQLSALHLTATQRATLMKEISSSGPRRDTLWVNHLGLIVAEQTVERTTLLGTSTLRTTVTVLYSKFGQPVTVGVPPASSVVPYHTFLTDSTKYLG